MACYDTVMQNGLWYEMVVLACVGAQTDTLKSSQSNTAAPPCLVAGHFSRRGGGYSALQGAGSQAGDEAD